MGDTERASNDTMQSLQPSFEYSSQQVDLNQMSKSIGHESERQSFGSDCGKRVGIPPSHPNQITPISPYLQMPSSRQPSQALSFQNFGSHSRSSSQPSFANLDSLPPLSPSMYRDSSSNSSDKVSMDVIMGNKGSNGQIGLASSNFLGGNYGFYSSESLPPRKTHRRSVSDSAFGFSALLESSLSPSPYSNIESVKSEFVWNGNSHKNDEGKGERKLEGEVIDELFSTYMNLDNVEPMRSSESNDKIGYSHHENGHGGDNSDNETEGSINEISNGNATPEVSEVVVKKECMKRSATQDITPSSRHYRSTSMDSFMGSMAFGEDSLKLPPRPLKASPSSSIDKNLNTFSLEFGNGEFSGEELKKIMANDKLAEMALADPKRVKRILANRQSAARSKERKMRYISELEHKVQTLQSEVTTLSSQVTQLKRDSVVISSQNNELRFRLQAMEQQAQLRDALNETLHGEVQTLRLTTQQLGLNSHSPKDMFQIQDPRHETSQPQMSS